MEKIWCYISLSSLNGNITGREVTSLYSSIGHSKYVNRSPPISFHSSPSNYQKFRAHNIDGSALLKLTESHLVDVMKFSLGPSVKLTNAVADKIRYLMKMKDVDKCIFDEF